ncbi:MAG: hypothetical protein LBP53_08525 [Candidatus Peribacteria bacterium]|jgi:hypothetical protein|nr:hypothetical protein [Candidatus Peribacteria bacterium]
MEDFGQERKDLISTDDTPETLLYNKENSIESTNTTAIQADASKRLSTFYSKIKTYLNTTTINEKNPTAQLSISSIENVGLVDINIILTGSQSCLKIDNTDLCK